MAGVDPRLLRQGADNVVQRCLVAQAGERVGLLSWNADGLREVVADAVRAAGAEPVLVPIDDLVDASESRATLVLTGRLARCEASAMLAVHGVPPSISMGVLEAAEQLSLRHLHLTRIDPRLFAQSYRADPERIAQINARMTDHLGGARLLEVWSPAGTELTVKLDARYPMLSMSGRPEPGRPDNLPSGTLIFHPASVDGAFVADRGAIGAVRPDPALVRRYPITVHFEAGRARAVESGSRELVAEVEAFFAMHEHARRVGLVALPTNYVVRSESGMEVQDGLLPGVNVVLGYSSPTTTHAPYHCPIQLRLFGRRIDAKAGGSRLVAGGRLTSEIVGDLDPFR